MFGGGSVGRIAVDCYRVLTNNDIESTIVYGRGVPPKDVTTYKIGNTAGIYLHVLLTRLFDACGYGSYFATKKLIRYLEEYNPDVIHMHNLHGYYINVFLLFDYLKKTNKRVIWTLHDCWSYTGHCPYYSLEKCEKWKTGCKKCIRKHEHPKSLFWDGSKRNYNDKRRSFCGVDRMTIVTPSQWLKREVQQSFLKEYPIEVINNGIDVNVFYPRDNSVREKYRIGDKFVILGVANVWGYPKGLDVFEYLADTLDFRKYQIIMVGLTEMQIKNIDKRILALKHTESVDALAELYSAADVFLNPTRCDNFPTPNLEAQACGTPVITFTGTGSPESVGCECGIIVEQNDLEGIKEAILECQKNPKSIEACVEHANNYKKEIAYTQYLELYMQG